MTRMFFFDVDGFQFLVADSQDILEARSTSQMIKKDSLFISEDGGEFCIKDEFGTFKSEDCYIHIFVNAEDIKWV